MSENMILLITPSTRRQECARALQATTMLPTDAASSLQMAVGRLREREYSAVVIDQCLMEAEPDEGQRMLQHLGAAFPVLCQLRHQRHQPGSPGSAQRAEPSRAGAGDCSFFGSPRHPERIDREPHCDIALMRSGAGFDRDSRCRGQ